MTAKELLSAVRAAQGIPSNYRLAVILGIREGAITRWNSGRGAPDDAMAARLAEMAGLDPDSVVAAMYAQRAHDEGDRARWLRISQRLAATASVAACAVLSLWTTAPQAQAAPLATHASPVNIAVDGLYIVRSFIAALVRSLAPRFPLPMEGFRFPAPSPIGPA